MSDGGGAGRGGGGPGREGGGGAGGSDAGSSGSMIGLAGRVRRKSRPGRPGGRALAGSVALHGVAVTVLILSGVMAAPEPDTFIAYEVKLVSPAAAQSAPEPTEAEPPPEEEEEAPEPEPEEPEEPEPEPEPVTNPEPDATIPEEPEREEEPPETEPEPEPEPEEEPEEEASAEPEEERPTSPQPTPEDSATGGEALNVSITGEQFPFPGYLDNIIVQINRYFRWTGRSDLEAEFAFVIHRDGSVSNLRVLRGSGDVSFDYEAMGAIEQAAQNGAFGELPDGFEGDRLPISFYFRPPQ